MKKIIFAAIVCCGAVVNVNAEELNVAPKQVINETVEVAEAPEAIEAPEVANDTTVVVYMLNPAGPEYSESTQLQIAQGQSDAELPGQKWRVCLPIGNNLRPVELWSADRYGAYVSVSGKYSHFYGYNLFHVGAEAGYLKRWGGLGGFVEYGQGRQANSSASKAHVNELNYGLKLYLPCAEIHCGRDILQIRPFCTLGAKKARDVQYLQSSSYYTNEISEGTELVTTVKTDRIDARPRVLKWNLGIHIQYDFWGSPLSIFAEGAYGKTQNFTYIESQWHAETEVRAGLSIRLGNRHKFHRASDGRYLYEMSGYSREEIKKHNW